MKYALAFVLAVSCVALVAEDDASNSPSQESQEFTKEEMAVAKQCRERSLKQLRDELAGCQKRLSANRSPVDSEQRKELKDAVAKKKEELATAIGQPTSHWLKQAEAEKEIQEKQAAKAIEESRKERERIAAEEEETRKNRPISIEAIGLRPNVINLPELIVICRNNTTIPVEAYTINAECFNKFDEPVADIAGNNVFKGISQTTIQAGKKERSSWQMSLHRNTAYAKVWISRVRFATGAEWNQTKEEAKSRQRSFVRIDMD